MNFKFQPLVRGIRAVSEHCVRRMEAKARGAGLTVPEKDLSKLDKAQLEAYRLQLKKATIAAYKERKEGDNGDGGTPPSAAAPVTPIQPKPTPAPVKGLITATKAAPVSSTPTAKAQPLPAKPAAAPAKPELHGLARAAAAIQLQIGGKPKAETRLPIDPRPVTTAQLCITSIAARIYGENQIRQLEQTVGSENLENRCGRLLHMDSLGSYIPGFNASIFADIAEPRKIFGMDRIGHAEKVRKLQTALLEQGISFA